MTGIDHNSRTSRAIEIRHHYEAAPDEVFLAWTVPERVATWWAPAGFTAAVHNMTVEVGGTWRIGMTSPAGETCEMTGTYLLVEPGRALVFDVTSHCNLGLPDGVPRQTETSTVTVRFLPSGSGTELVLTQTPLTEGYDRVARPSWVGVLSALGRALGRALARATQGH